MSHQNKTADQLFREWQQLRSRGQEVGVEDFCAEEGISDSNLLQEFRDRVSAAIEIDDEEGNRAEQSLSTTTHQKDEGVTEVGEVGEVGDLDIPDSSGVIDTLKGRTTSADSTIAPNLGPTSTDSLEEISCTASFESFHLLAKGGLGEVYEAKHRFESGNEPRQESRMRPVAVKLIRPDKLDSKKRRMFADESVITAKLEHPGVVPIYGFGTAHDGRPFYVMRLIEGQTMRQRIKQFHAKRHSGGVDQRENSVPFRELLNQLIAVCNTLAYAHDCGIVHRDVKPDNIMLGPFGETLLVDWGLARTYHRGGKEKSSQLPTLISQTRDRRFSQGIEGTPNYMSPEQANPEAYVGKATDVYSLGACLYEILTGKHAIPGKDLAEVLNMVRTNSIKPPRQVNDDVPIALEAVAMKALSRAEDDRYSSALELADDVKRYMSDEPVRAYDEPWHIKTQRWMRRNKSITHLALAGVLAAVVAMTAVATNSRAHMGNLVDQKLVTLKTQADKQERMLLSDIERLRRDAKYLASLPGVVELAESAYDPTEETISPKRSGHPTVDALATRSETATPNEIEESNTAESPPESESEQRSAIADLLRKTELSFIEFISRDEGYIQARIIAADGRERLRVERTNGQVTRRTVQSGFQDKSGSYYFEFFDKFFQEQEYFGPETYLSEFDINKEQGKKDFETPVVRACAPITRDGKLIGIAVINMHFRRLDEFIRHRTADHEEEKQMMVYLTNDQGDFLIHEERDIGFSFERDLTYRIRDVYRKLAGYCSRDQEVLSGSPQDSQAVAQEQSKLQDKFPNASVSVQIDQKPMSREPGFEMRKAVPKCGVFIRPLSTKPDEEGSSNAGIRDPRSYAELNRLLNYVFEEYEQANTDVAKDSQSCHGIITGLDAETADRIVKDLTPRVQGMFEVVRLPRKDRTASHTVFCKKIRFDTDDPERFLSLVLAVPSQ